MGILAFFGILMIVLSAIAYPPVSAYGTPNANAMSGVGVVVALGTILTLLSMVYFLGLLTGKSFLRRHEIEKARS